MSLRSKWKILAILVSISPVTLLFTNAEKPILSIRQGTHADLNILENSNGMPKIKSSLTQSLTDSVNENMKTEEHLFLAEVKIQRNLDRQVFYKWILPENAEVASGDVTGALANLSTNSLHQVKLGLKNTDLKGQVFLKVYTIGTDGAEIGETRALNPLDMGTVQFKASNENKPVSSGAENL